MTWSRKLLHCVCVLLIVLSLGHWSQCCVLHSDCGPSGLCLDGKCYERECHHSAHCVSHGLYFKCVRGQCLPSKQRICRRDADCKRNLFGRKCKHYTCA